MKGEVLRLLKESDGFLSGQEICGQMDVSRAAVWKVIEQLRKEGYTIEAIRNRGYRLQTSPDVITKEELESRAHTKWAGKQVVYFERTDSTNVQAKQYGNRHAQDAGAAGKPTWHGMLFVADAQEAGRGRRGRVWESPVGSSLAVSILLRPDMQPSKAPMLTLVMALAAARSIQKMTSLPVQIKWPNDIICGGKKLAGILTEMSTEIDYINHVVIGIGLNVHTKHFSRELESTATSLYMELHKDGRNREAVGLRRAELICGLMQEFEQLYEVVEEYGDLTPCIDEYNSLLVNRGRVVRVLEPKGDYEAEAHGINERGDLLVTTESGEQRNIYSGEVSVRGVYGYV